MMAVDRTRAILEYHAQHQPAPLFKQHGTAECGTSHREATRAKSSSAKKTTSRQRRTQKRVRFASSVKVHDGLSPHNFVYDEVVHDLFNRPTNRYRTIRGILNSCNVVVLQRLREQLLRLMQRCSQGKTPVLNCGGGRNNVVDERFAPWLQKLANKIAIAVGTITSCQKQKKMPMTQLRLGDSFRI